MVELWRGIRTLVLYVAIMVLFVAASEVFDWEVDRLVLGGIFYLVLRQYMKDD